jgi:Leucine-rich repeat (LRR) protein
LNLLDLSWTKISDVTFKGITNKLENVNSLNLDWCLFLSDAMIAGNVANMWLLIIEILRGVPNVTYLSLRKCSTYEHSLSSLLQLTKLVTLNITHNHKLTLGSLLQIRMNNPTLAHLDVEGLPLLRQHPEFLGKVKNQ